MSSYIVDTLVEQHRDCPERFVAELQRCEDGSTLAAGVDVLARLPGDAALKELKRLAETDHVSVRRLALRGLARHSVDGQLLLLGLLVDAKRPIRCAAAKVLGQQPAAILRDILCSAVRDPAFSVEQLIEAFRQLANEPLTPGLHRYLSELHVSLESPVSRSVSPRPSLFGLPPRETRLIRQRATIAGLRPKAHSNNEDEGDQR